MSPLTWQRRLLRAGAVFDAAFALPMLLLPVPAAGLLRVSLPEDPTWFRLCGVLLLIVAGCYAVAAAAPGDMAHRVGLVAAGGRLLGCLVLVGAGLSGQGPAVTATGIADGVLGLAHLGLAALVVRAGRAPGGIP